MQDLFAKQFADLPSITGLPFRMSGGRWIAACYMNGKIHHQKDKTYAILKHNGIYLKEQGGEDLSLPEFLEQYGDKSKLGDFDHNRDIPEVEQIERIFVDSIHWESTIPAQYKGNLYLFLSKVFSPEKVTEVFHRYNVGENELEDVIYWYMNEANQVCHDAIVPYGTNGKRLKERGGYRRHKVDMGYSGKTCFGSHLLPFYKPENVCVVESEKAALIMAMVENRGRLWVAVGGDQKIFMARDEWKRYGDFDNAGRKWSGVKWWTGFDVNEGDGPDDLILKIFKKKISKIVCN